ncbi:MAG: hypothetical protein ACRD24_08820 [Terriglobales bacterium]
MEDKLRILRVIHAALLLSCFIYAVIGEAIGPAEPKDVKLFLMVFGFLGVTDIGIAMLLRPRFVGEPEEILRRAPNDASALQRWLTGHFILYAMCESVAILGLVLRIVGATLVQVMPFYGAAVLLMLVWMPRRPE